MVLLALLALLVLVLVLVPMLLLELLLVLHSLLLLTLPQRNGSQKNWQSRSPATLLGAAPEAVNVAVQSAILACSPDSDQQAPLPMH